MTCRVWIPKDIEVALLSDRLTIRGERRAERETDRAHYVAREVSYGRFERAFSVPEGIDADKIEARYTDGILEVTLPLPSRATARKVPIAVEHQPSVSNVA